MESLKAFQYHLPVNSEALIVGVLVFAFFYLRFSQTPYQKALRGIPGPEPPSWVMGSLYDWKTGDGLMTTRKWIQRYGDVLRIKTLFGTDRLFISDPAAITHIMTTASYEFPKTAVALTRIARVLSVGLVWAEGEDHRRQRRVMNPAFIRARVYELLPHFTQGSRKLVEVWDKKLGNKDDMVINVMEDLSASTMDIMGKAAFGLDFRCMEDPSQPIMQVYRGFLAAAAATPSPFSLILTEYSESFPTFVKKLMAKLPANAKRMKDLQYRNKIAEAYAENVVSERIRMLEGGKNISAGPEDMLTSFVRANFSANPKNRLSHAELVAQIRTLIFAGHDSTTHTITYALYQLALNPSAQDRLREEAQTMLGNNLTAEDYANAPILNACIKESMRILPAVPTFTREATLDSTIPLTTPIKTTDGRTVDQLLVPKGTEILLSVADYNTSPAIWGDDSYTFNIDRFLRDEGPMKSDLIIPGSFGGLLSFLTGPRICLGWRFAILEVQVVLADLVSRYKFELREPSMKVERLNAPIMSPVVDGKISVLPLRVSRLA